MVRNPHADNRRGVGGYALEWWYDAGHVDDGAI